MTRSGKSSQRKSLTKLARTPHSVFETDVSTPPVQKRSVKPSTKATMSTAQKLSTVDNTAEKERFKPGSKRGPIYAGNDHWKCRCCGVYHGEWIECGNKDCTYIWLGLDDSDCVGLTKAPRGKWLCPVCSILEADAKATSAQVPPKLTSKRNVMSNDAPEPSSSKDITRRKSTSNGGRSAEPSQSSSKSGSLEKSSPSKGAAQKKNTSSGGKPASWKGYVHLSEASEEERTRLQRGVEEADTAWKWQVDPSLGRSRRRSRPSGLNYAHPTRRRTTKAVKISSSQLVQEEDEEEEEAGDDEEVEKEEEEAGDNEEGEAEPEAEDEVPFQTESPGGEDVSMPEDFDQGMNTTSDDSAVHQAATTPSNGAASSPESVVDSDDDWSTTQGSDEASDDDVRQRIARSRAVSESIGDPSETDVDSQDLDATSDIATQSSEEFASYLEFHRGTRRSDSTFEGFSDTEMGEAGEQVDEGEESDTLTVRAGSPSEGDDVDEQRGAQAADEMDIDDSTRNPVPNDREAADMPSSVTPTEARSERSEGTISAADRVVALAQGAGSQTPDEVSNNIDWMDVLPNGYSPSSNAPTDERSEGTLDTDLEMLDGSYPEPVMPNYLGTTEFGPYAARRI